MMSDFIATNTCMTTAFGLEIGVVNDNVSKSWRHSVTKDTVEHVPHAGSATVNRPVECPGIEHKNLFSVPAFRMPCLICGVFVFTGSGGPNQTVSHTESF